MFKLEISWKSHIFILINFSQSNYFVIYNSNNFQLKIGVKTFKHFRMLNKINFQAKPNYLNSLEAA